MRNRSGLYIHIPYCIQKCSYCDFKSYSGREDTMPEYFHTLKQEILLKSRETEPAVVDSIFIGGGTPSCVPVFYITELMEEISQVFQLSDSCEITLEANPGTVTLQKLQTYRENGINRLSFGLQSGQDAELKRLGRIHTFADYLQSIEFALQAGFSNINTDLIFGIPEQTLHSFQTTLETVCSPAVTHFSLYSLIVEDGTPFAGWQEKGLLQLPEETEEREMYHWAIAFLKERGYRHYEISNFAREGYACRHNIKYWKTEPYLGVGSAAHSYLAGRRSWNHDTIETYIKTCSGVPETADFEQLTQSGQMQEYMMLGLRLISGVDKQEFHARFGRDCSQVFAKEIENLKQKDLISETEERVCLTTKGLDYANLAFMEFV